MGMIEWIPQFPASAVNRLFSFSTSSSANHESIGHPDRRDESEAALLLLRPCPLFLFFSSSL